MSKSRHTVSDVFAMLIQPVADAVSAEVGVDLSPELFVSAARRSWLATLHTLAAVLRFLASHVEPADLEPAPVPEAPAPVLVVATEPAPVPFGWGSLDLPTPTVTDADVDPFTAEEWAAIQWEPTADAPAVVAAPAPVRPVEAEEQPPAKLWTVAVIASVHGLSVPTLKRHLQQGKLRGTKDDKGAWSVTDADLDAYLATRTATASK